MTTPLRTVDPGIADANVSRRVAGAAAPSAHDPIIVHSHLRWDFVWQRPQQLMSRLAASRRILFVEEPVFLDDLVHPVFHLTRPQRHLTRAIPRLPSSLRDNQDEIEQATRALLQELVGPGGECSGEFDGPVQWFYTPMPAPAMIDAIDARAIVYDCMDELSQFRFAPAQLILRERYLLARADVVFTGGRGLWEAKSRHHDNVHFYGCGVEVRHFARARAADTLVSPDVAALPRPVLGYVGVIDERLDYELLREVARAWPEASIAMVGPTVKVDPRELPNEPNVHWLGQRPYEELPALVKGFDVCMMPFALNEATEYINPTKTLEYLAAGKPVVSTAVPDVVRNFSDVLDVVATPSEFVARARASVERPDERRIALGIDRAAESSWENIVGEMSAHIERAARRHARVGRPARTATLVAAPRVATLHRSS